MCCRTLRTKVRGHAHREISPGLYETEGPGGLQVLTFELRRQRQSGEVRASPRVAAATRDEMLVLAWELDHDACPLEKHARCTVYADRPIVCRAFPLILERGTLSASSVCHRIVPLTDAPSATYAREYAAARSAVEAAQALEPLLQLVLRHGRSELVSGLRPSQLDALPRRDLIDAAEAAGITTEAELRARFHAV